MTQATPAPSSTALAADAELVAACLAGSHAAWNEIVRQLSRYVYAICLQAYRLGHHDAEDVFQETFIRLHQQLGNLRDPGSLRPWIGQVTRRLCIDRLRMNGRSVPTDALDHVGTDDALASIEDALAVHAAMARLPEHSREILDRFFCRDESYQTIGEELGIPPGTVASRISRGLAALREIMEKA